MSAGEWLTIINVLVAFLGVAFAGFALFSWLRLRSITKRVEGLRREVADSLYASLKATHRVLASYQIKDVDQRIALLESAVTACPSAFNVYNALGYAWIEKGDLQKAIDAFSQAVHQHPDAKEGFCDLAYAHLQAGNVDLMVKYFRKAIAVDPTAKSDIKGDPRLKDYLPQIL